MGIDHVCLGHVRVSRLILGGNPFSGFSHQTAERDREMKDYFTAERIKQTYRRAESLGIDAHIGRADHHIMRVLLEHWNEGGGIQWIAQTCPGVGSIDRGIDNAIEGRAKACFIHGGLMDMLFGQRKLEEIPGAIARIRKAGMPAGIAGHNPEVFEWAEENLDVDFYMCCYYNPTSRNEHGEHVAGVSEWFRPKDRDRMAQVIGSLSKPAIHYKVFAAGRTPPEEAFDFVARHLRDQDAVCVGVYPKDNPAMLEEDLRLLERSLKNAAQGG